MCILQRCPPLMMTGLTFKTARELVQDPHACFRVVSAKKPMALLPKYIDDLSRGIREQLDAEVNLYSAKLNGVMVAYSNVRRFQEHGTVLGSQPYLYLYIQADFIVFQPTTGSIVKGVVNKVGRDFIGCLVHGCFNASVPKRSRDGVSLIDGVEIAVGETFLFQVVKYIANNYILSIRGSFYEDSFTELPTPGPTSKTCTADEMDGIEDSAQELPTILHSRRRTTSVSIAIPMEESEPILRQVPASNVDLSFTEFDGSTLRKNAKKKKKRREDDEDVVTTSNANYIIDANQSHDGRLVHVNGIDQSLGEGNSIDTGTSNCGSSKKRKKHKQKNGKESPINNNSAAKFCQETIIPVQETVLQVPESQPIDDSPRKKKKKSLPSSPFKTLLPVQLCSSAELPIPRHDSKKHTVNKMGGIGRGAEELPTIIHKRRRTASVGPVVPVEAGEPILTQDPVSAVNLSLTEFSDSLSSEGTQKKKKKKKKKKRDDEDLDISAASYVVEADLSQEGTLGHVDGIDQTGEGNRLDGSFGGSSKKTRKHKRESGAESLTNDNSAANSCQETVVPGLQTVVQVSETQPVDDGVPKKRRKNTN